MDIVTQIRAWLIDGYYLQGVELYRQVGGAFPMSAFEGYEEANYVPKDVENRLRYALEQYVTGAPIFEQTTIHHPQKEAKTFGQNMSNVVVATTTPTSEPDAILRLRKEARQLHKRQDDLKSRINLMAENPTRFKDHERYQVAEELIDVVTPELDGIYDRIRDWKKTGELPAVAKNNIVKDTVKKMQKLAALKSRVSRLKGMLNKRMLEVDRNKYEKELLEKRVEVKELEEELGIE